jgi:hypothetical protein
MKVFGIGLNKTGTTTLGVCLEKLGYRTEGFDETLIKHVKNGNLKPVYKVTDEYDAFQDWPWPLIYQKLDERYENSKFILTTRKSAQDWFGSLKKHSERRGPEEFRNFIYGCYMPHGNKKELIFKYKKHNEEVNKYFEDRDEDFLEVCWETGSGWGEICDFLGHDPPDIEFPHANQRPNKRSVMERIRSMIKSS